MVAGGILLANIAAGLLTVVMYQLTLMTPYYPFVAAMTLTVSLILVRLITSPAHWGRRSPDSRSAW